MTTEEHLQSVAFKDGAVFRELTSAATEVWDIPVDRIGEQEARDLFYACEICLMKLRQLHADAS